MTDRHRPDPRVTSRRAVLAAGLALPLLAGCGDQKAGLLDPSAQGLRRPASEPSPSSGIAMRTGLLRSRHWPDHPARWIVMWPDHVDRPRVVVSLHGKDGDADASFSALHLQDHILDTGLAVAAIDGGNYYWHARRSESTGDDDISPDTPPCDTGAMVTDDFIPLLGRLGLEVRRVGFLGWSMGGYGALLLSETLGSARVAAVAPMSAALWTEPGLSAPGAFDDAEDWYRHDVFARRSRFADLPIRLACGTSDPFYAADRAFVAGFPPGPAYDVTSVFDPGGHDDAFWASHSGAQMHFLAAHLDGS